MIGGVLIALITSAVIVHTLRCTFGVRHPNIRSLLNWTRETSALIGSVFLYVGIGSPREVTIGMADTVWSQSIHAAFGRWVRM